MSEPTTAPVRFTSEVQPGHALLRGTGLTDEPVIGGLAISGLDGLPADVLESVLADVLLRIHNTYGAQDARRHGDTGFTWRLDLALVGDSRDWVSNHREIVRCAAIMAEQALLAAGHHMRVVPVPFGNLPVFFFVTPRTGVAELTLPPRTEVSNQLYVGPRVRLHFSTMDGGVLMRTGQPTEEAPTNWRNLMDSAEKILGQGMMDHNGPAPRPVQPIIILS